MGRIRSGRRRFSTRWRRGGDALPSSLSTSTSRPRPRRSCDGWPTEGHAIGLHSGHAAPDAHAARRARGAAVARRRSHRVDHRQAPCRLFRPHAGWRSASMYQGLRAGSATGSAGGAGGCGTGAGGRRRMRCAPRAALSERRRRRHHRDSRWPPQESPRRSSSHAGDHPAPRAGARGERLFLSDGSATCGRCNAGASL